MHIPVSAFCVLPACFYHKINDQFKNIAREALLWRFLVAPLSIYKHIKPLKDGKIEIHSVYSPWTDSNFTFFAADAILNFFY